jgi:hypothetical protein
MKHITATGLEAICKGNLDAIRTTIKIYQDNERLSAQRYMIMSQADELRKIIPKFDLDKFLSQSGYFNKL